MTKQQSKIQHVFKTQPKVDTLFIAQDGTIFFKQNDAIGYHDHSNHHKKTKFMDVTTVTRSEANTWTGEVEEVEVASPKPEEKPVEPVAEQTTDAVTNGDEKTPQEDGAHVSTADEVIAPKKKKNKNSKK